MKEMQLIRNHSTMSSNCYTLYIYCFFFNFPPLFKSGQIFSWNLIGFWKIISKAIMADMAKISNFDPIKTISVNLKASNNTYCLLFFEQVVKNSIILYV